MPVWPMRSNKAPARRAPAYHLYYEYDTAHRLTRWHDNDQTWARYEYDAQGRCVYTTCADGFLTARFDYLPDRVVMTDGLGQHWPNHIPAFIIRYTFSFLLRQK